MGRECAIKRLWLGLGYLAALQHHQSIQANRMVSQSTNPKKNFFSKNHEIPIQLLSWGFLVNLLFGFRMRILRVNFTPMAIFTVLVDLG